MHPGKIIEIRFVPPILGFKHGKWNFVPGQYLSLNVPEISYFQWHPFTISSAPEDPYLSVHIKANGNWTTSFCNRLEKVYQVTQDPLKRNQMKPKDWNNLFPWVYASMPCFSPSDQIMQYSVSMVIGLGVGITPFISALKSIRRELQNSKNGVETRKVHFIWTCKAVEDFHCLTHFLREMENEGANNDNVKISLYLTLKETRASLAFHLHQCRNDETDPMTGLKAGTYYGRPRFDLLLKKFALEHSNEKEPIGVFMCGNKRAANHIRRICDNLSKSPKINFHPEVF